MQFGLLAAGALLVLAGGGALLAARDRTVPVAASGSADTPPERVAPAEPVSREAAPAPQPPPRPATPSGEAASVERLRALAIANPRQALALSAELDRRFPGGAFAEERASLVIDALVRLGDIGQARTNSEEFFGRFPRGQFGQHVETLTGVHPRPLAETEP